MNLFFYYSAGKRDRGKKTPPGVGSRGPSFDCSIEGRKTRREENVFKGVENLPALLYTIV